MKLKMLAAFEGARPLVPGQEYTFEDTAEAVRFVRAGFAKAADAETEAEIAAYPTDGVDDGAAAAESERTAAEAVEAERVAAELAAKAEAERIAAAAAAEAAEAERAAAEEAAKVEAERVAAAAAAPVRRAKS